jgi:hypothetical protein
MNNLEVNKTTIMIASTLALIYRTCFSAILIWAARESDSEVLKWTLLSIVSIMVTFGLFRFVKMTVFANNLRKLEKAFDK